MTFRIITLEMTNYCFIVFVDSYKNYFQINTISKHLVDCVECIISHYSKVY